MMKMAMKLIVVIKNVKDANMPKTKLDIVVKKVLDYLQLKKLKKVNLLLNMLVKF